MTVREQRASKPMSFCLALVFFMVASANAALADTFYVSYLGAGIQTPQGITANYETFNGISPGSSGSFTTTFGGSGITGTYSGDMQWYGADQFGGAAGAGTYPEVFSGSYQLSLSSPVNYFGLWFSALDSGNELQFLDNGTSVFSFSPAAFRNLVGACPGSAFCGNPTAGFAGQDSNEQFAYLNFYDQSGSFNEVLFSQTGGGGFESDNHAVAVTTGNPEGSPIESAPEPTTLVYLLFGAGVVGGAQLRRALAK